VLATGARCRSGKTRGNNLKLYSEEQLLDAKVRKLIIDEINHPTNEARKNEAKKRHEVFKDNTVKYVLKKLQNEGLAPATLTLMSNRAANISIAKKIVRKLARCYENGAVRETGVELLNQQVSMLAMLLDFDKNMKKVDRYLRLQRNCMPWFVPEPVEGSEKFTIKMKVLGPWQYDAVENYRDADCPIGIVLSDFYSPQNDSNIKSGRNQVTFTDAEGTEWNHDRAGLAQGDNVTSGDHYPATYIFWTAKYHFTCGKNGEIINAMSPEDLLNPIGELPGLPMAKDRDDSFWAGGGQDLVDGSILINTLITDLNAIMFMQGWGQMVITGPKGSIPRQFEGGPHRALVLTHDPKKGQGEAKVTVVQSNPPIDGWMRAVEQYVALLLTTNNLSPSSVSGKLDAASLPSGIAMLIEKSESTEDVKDGQADFGKAERHCWRKVAKWVAVYKSRGALAEEFAAAPIPETIAVSTKFKPTEQVVSEGEKLDNMKKKKDLGLVRQVELIMEENPGMTEQEAELKLLQIKKERVEEAALMAQEMLKNNPPDGPGGNQFPPKEGK
jgi:hypothetical protein